MKQLTSEEAKIIALADVIYDDAAALRSEVRRFLLEAETQEKKDGKEDRS